jgi:hypothetical protein
VLKRAASSSPKFCGELAIRLSNTELHKTAFSNHGCYDKAEYAEPNNGLEGHSEVRSRNDNDGA